MKFGVPTRHTSACCPLVPHRYVRPGGGFVPNFQLFQKGDVNGAKEQKVYSFLKVGAVPRVEGSTQILGVTQH